MGGREKAPTSLSSPQITASDHEDQLLPGLKAFPAVVLGHTCISPRSVVPGAQRVSGEGAGGRTRLENGQKANWLFSPGFRRKKRRWPSGVGEETRWSSVCLESIYSAKERG